MIWTNVTQKKLNKCLLQSPGGRIYKTLALEALMDLMLVCRGSASVVRPALEMLHERHNAFKKAEREDDDFLFALDLHRELNA